MAIAATVLMPVFNGAAYISEAIQSVLAQTEPNFELLIIDDGSTDDTQSVVASFQHDARLRYLYKANGGIVSALNLGLNHAQSAFIVRLDADDVMLPHRIATQLDFMGQHPHLHGASSDFGWMDKDGVRRGSISIPLTSKAAVDRTLNASLPLIFCHSAIIYRRDTVLQLGAYRETYRDSEDVDLFTRMVDAGFEIVSQPEVLTIVRVHDGSISSRARRRRGMLNNATVFHRKAGLPEYYRRSAPASQRDAASETKFRGSHFTPAFSPQNGHSRHKGLESKPAPLGIACGLE